MPTGQPAGHAGPIPTGPATTGSPETVSLMITTSQRISRAEFLQRFAQNMASCPWRPDAEYSVFTQFDGVRYYEPQRQGFERKYRCMWSVARSLMPQKIVELGTNAGSSADAYISASGADYVGYDLFGVGRFEWKDEPWNPMVTCIHLFQKRKFVNYKLCKANLRQLAEIEAGDLIVVDAAHDYDNQLGDLELALTGNPTWIFVDDVNGADVARALSTFLRRHAAGIEWGALIDYPDGGLLLQLKPPA
jgi:hypothetical protein